MANANKHNIGNAAQGKGAGVGGMTDLPDGLLEENMVLSNRDKAQHGQERGLDSKGVQIEQFQDTASNRLVDDVEDMASNDSGMSNPMSDTSSEDSSLKKPS